MEERESLLEEVQPADGELHMDSPDDGYWAQMRKRWPHWGSDNQKKRTHSNYLALIPLDDERLNPRKTRCLIGSIAFVAFALILAVFFAVPRGVSVSVDSVETSEFSWNRTGSAYNLELSVQLIAQNPNYAHASLTGALSVYFFDMPAGKQILDDFLLKRRSTRNFSVDMKANQLDQRYRMTVVERCLAAPHELIFFLRAEMDAHFLGHKQEIPKIDTYFVVNCTLNGTYWLPPDLR